MFFSNGPGDPEATEDVVDLLRSVLDAGMPYFGICFGNQLFGRALGFGTYKLGYGHRGINQPVMDLTTRRVEITAHNHGFAVDAPLDRPTETAVRGRGSATSGSTTTWSRGSRSRTTTARCCPSRCSTTPRPRPARTTPLPVRPLRRPHVRPLERAHAPATTSVEGQDL